MSWLENRKRLEKIMEERYRKQNIPYVQPTYDHDPEIQIKYTLTFHYGDGKTETTEEKCALTECPFIASAKVVTHEGFTKTLFDHQAERKELKEKA